MCVCVCVCVVVMTVPWWQFTHPVVHMLWLANESKQPLGWYTRRMTIGLWGKIDLH